MLTPTFHEYVEYIPEDVNGREENNDGEEERADRVRQLPAGELNKRIVIAETISPSR